MSIYKLREKITFAFIAITAVLILLQIIILYLIANSHLSPDSGFVHLFDLNKEKNVPAVFSTFGLFLSGIILLIIANKESGMNRFCWFSLSVIFFFLAYDELFAFHENMIKPLRTYLNVSGYLYFAWVIPYGIATFILMIVLYKFLAKLPQRTKWYLYLSGFIYVSGALGFELLGAKQYVSDGEVQTLAFRILYTIEESFEMSAVILFLYTTMDYLTEISKTKREPDIIQIPLIITENEDDYRNTGTL